jgi:FdhD protein
LPHNKTEKSKIHKWSNNTLIEEDDDIAIECPLEIRLSHDRNKFQTLAITLCTPSDIDDLIYGYLLTESIINKSKDILEIKTFDNDLGLIAEVLLGQDVSFERFLNKRQGMVHASCGICGKTEFENLLTFDYLRLEKLLTPIDHSVICSLPEKLSQKQQGYIKTGGLHACALFDSNGHILFVKEDIGRHNALDKLIGYALQQQLIPLGNYIILLSGRVSFELVHKSLIAGLSHLCAIGAPSSLSIEIARLNGLSLMGFVNAAGFNRY